MRATRSRKIFDFLGRGENRVVKRVLENLDISMEASSHVLSLIRALKIHDYEAVLAENKVISDLENRADDAHLRVVEEICSGSFFGGIREDFLELCEQIDSIADAAKDCSRIFRQRQISSSAIDYLFREDVVSFIQKCIDTTMLFRKAVSALTTNKYVMIKLSSEVEKSEEEADAIMATILENLLRNEAGVDVLDVIMLKDFLNMADDMADYSEDGSDVLLALAAKGYS